jgi:iron complex transport system ATP-binding protein
VELLNLVQSLNRHDCHTVVTVLHDLNLAARYAGVLVAMKDGLVTTADARLKLKRLSPASTA